MSPITPLEKIDRPEFNKLNVIIVGAGLGGLTAAVSISLAGHTVTVLESSPQIGDVGAGIQILPNASLVLQSLGLKSLLEPHATHPSCVNMLKWNTGEVISTMGFEESAAKYPGSFYWDFHRAELHGALLKRARDVGAKVECGMRVVGVRVDDGRGISVVGVEGRDGSGSEEMECDLVVGADGVNSRLRDMVTGTVEKPVETGDLAYRLLLDTEKMLEDPELRTFVTEPQVNYWLGPDMHAVNYVLRGGKLFNMVLLVPDDMPAGASTLEGNVEEMRALFKDWDPRIPKLLALCQSVYKWRLCIRPSMSPWSHPSGTFTMLGDAAHATLPYLASGAGMALEDAAVLGTCLSRVPLSTDPLSPASKIAFLKKALAVYETCRRDRTDMVVERGNLQQYLYHLPDGPAQEERDRKMRHNGRVPDAEQEDGEALAWRDPGLAPKLLGYRVEEDVERNWRREEGKGEVETAGQSVQCML